MASSHPGAPPAESQPADSSESLPRVPAPAPQPRVLMYATSWCPYCERARQLLAGKGVMFEEIDVELHPERRTEMIQRSGRRTVPQIFVGARHIGGSDDLYELDVSGTLDRLLQGFTDQAGKTHGQ